MAAKFSRISMDSAWVIESLITGFKPIVHQASLSAEISYDPATVKIFGKEYSLAGSATTTINLKTDLDFFSAAVNMTKACALFITASGNNVTVTFNGTDGLDAWIVQGGGSLLVKSGGFVGGAWPYATAATVDNTHKNIVLTNASGAAATGKILVIGG